MKTGIELIAEERQEQIEKHGYDVINPANIEYYHPRKLVDAALFAITMNDDYYPKKWGTWWKDNMYLKNTTLGYPERLKQRLIIAGALLAAEIDRIQSIQKLEMENNLELYKRITFDELIRHGLENGANVVNGMPMSWKINGKSVTHENDDCYIIEVAKEGFNYLESEFKKFKRGDELIAIKHGLHIFPYYPNYDTHSPGGCPM